MAKNAYVCRDCKRLFDEQLAQCSYCKGNNITDKYKGRIVIVDSKTSKVAKLIKVEDNGNYALKL